MVLSPLSPSKELMECRASSYSNQINMSQILQTAQDSLEHSNYAHTCTFSMSIGMKGNQSILYKFSISKQKLFESNFFTHRN